MMEKHDNDKVFDGNKFVVWKFHTRMCLKEKRIMKIANGTGAKPTNSASNLD